MLKSLPTQFAATLFFGPLGLLYSSVAACVFLTLLLAVLYFTELGALSAMVIWPISIIAGLVFVKLHNDQVRSSGSRLLLGPGEEESLVTALGSWGRGIAVLALMGIVGYLVYWYSPANSHDRMVNAATMDKAPGDAMIQTDAQIVGAVSTDNDIDFVTVVDPVTPIVTTASVQTDSRPVIQSEPASVEASSVETSSQESVNVEPVAVEPATVEPATVTRSTISRSTSESRQPPATSTIPEVSFTEQPLRQNVATSGESEVINGNVLYVDSPVVNLRDGPGTNFSILSQVDRGEELIEIDRVGSWINVSVTNSGTTGWIFNRLVSTQR